MALFLMDNKFWVPYGIKLTIVRHTICIFFSVFFNYQQKIGYVIKFVKKWLQWVHISLVTFLMPQ
jgi:hypothetical protein